MNSRQRPIDDGWTIENSPEFERQSSNDVRSDSVGGSEKQRRRGRPPTSLPPAPDRSTKPRFISSVSPSDGPARKPFPSRACQTRTRSVLSSGPYPRRSSGSSTPKLDHLSRGFFALAAGACWRAVKDAGLFSVVDTGSLCELAAVGGHTALLRYARQHGCPWDTRTCEGAARGGHLGCLWFASKLGCPWDERTCQVAAGNGQLRCLRHAQETGCPGTGRRGRSRRAGISTVFDTRTSTWDGATCASAARGGHLECLRYAHENGCPWDGATCASAAGEGIWSACAMHMRMDART